jgi:hypothetical protein
VAGDAKSPLALWHLLSLDAPTVAVLWTWFIARVCHRSLSLVSVVAMAAAVWTLYAGDRLLDARTSDVDTLEARHHFHHRHRKAFLTGIAAASVLLAALLPRIPPAAVHLYLILGGLVFGYFVVIHATESAHRLPKEIAVGVCFAAAVFIPTVARDPELRAPLLPAALLFASLCSLNCLFIYAWEHPLLNRPSPHSITRFAVRRLPTIGLAVCLVSAVMAASAEHSLWAVYVAVSLAAGTLLLLHQGRSSRSRLTLRTAADLALLTPVVLLPFL